MPTGNQNYKSTNLMSIGVPAAEADAIADSFQSATAALGNTLAAAATSNADIVHLGSVASNNNGFALRVGTGFKKRQTVINGTSTAALIYPPTVTGFINNQAAGTSFSLASGLAATFASLDANGLQYWKL